MTADQSGKVRIWVLDSDAAIQQLFYQCAQENSQAAAYHTVRNADSDVDAGSAVRCCAVRAFLRYRCEGGRADPDYGPWSASHFSNRVPHPFNNSKICKNMTGFTKGGADPFLLSKYHSKNFLKAVGWDRNPDPDPRIRIHKKKSSICRMQIIPDRTWSGSAYCTGSNANAYGFGFPSPDSRIFMRTPDSHRVCTVWYGPPPPDPVGLQQFFCKGT
jgi:hypothetical protein